VAIRDTTVTARHSGEFDPARLSIDLVSHTGGCKPPIVAAPAAARPESGPRSAESARAALTPRPSGGSLVPANHRATQRLMVPKRVVPPFSRSVHPDTGACSRRSGCSSSNAGPRHRFRKGNITTPLRWQIEAGRCARALSVAGVAVAWCEDKSLYRWAKAMARCVLSNRKRVGGVCRVCRAARGRCRWSCRS
jgi:hypothetical protein